MRLFLERYCEQLLSHFGGIGGSWLQLVKKCLSEAAGVLAKPGRPSFEVSVVTQLSSELPRGSMLSTDGCMSVSRQAPELSVQCQMALSVAKDISFSPVVPNFCSNCMKSKIINYNFKGTFHMYYL